MIDRGELARLLSDRFALVGGGLPIDALTRRLRAINRLDDLTAIDCHPDDPLWYVVPQIIMARFGLQAFQAFETRHKVRRSFVFVHPAHQHIVPCLRESLARRWTVSQPVTRELTPQLICSLYGGYRWHAAYAAACRKRGDFGRPATILPLVRCTRAELEELITFKNENRSRFAEQIVVPRESLGQAMNGIIRAFHCPDDIENARQSLNLGLVHASEVFG